MLKIIGTSTALSLRKEARRNTAEVTEGLVMVDVGTAEVDNKL
jgi:hypothetical protein